MLKYLVRMNNDSLLAIGLGKKRLVGNGAWKEALVVARVWDLHFWKTGFGHSFNVISSLILLLL